MTLAPGAQLGPHQIIGLLGAGGMGEVYRAHDTKLNRQVAIKILPAEYARDPERVARFQREAQAVAALNHPGVAAIYELALANDVRFLVLELVEGETLAERLRRGPLPVEDALVITKEICEALEAAHEKGICHRDLKPANIKLTEEGRVKVLDFGLAKVLQDNSAHGSVANSPTLSLAGTLPGMILGTAGYMSPEQAKGFAADHRSDIFSLGCILYELLTGRQAFEGETASEILASVLKSEPDLSRLPARLNPRVVELLRRCLEKQPKRRWHAVADLRVEIEGVLASGVLAEPPRGAARAWWRRALPVAAGVLAGAIAAGAAVWNFKPAPQPTITRFSIAVPEEQQFTLANRHLLAWSPDGSQLAYVASNRLFLRTMDDVTSRPLASGDIQATASPVFSPDSRSLAFYSVTDRAIKRVSVSGGAAVTICGGIAQSPYGLDWSADAILFVLSQGVMRVSPNGGTPETIVPAVTGETNASPQMLPGGQHVLFSVAKGDAPNRWESGQIVVQRPGSSERKVLIDGGGDARYVPTGHLVYALSGTLFAVPFDVQRLEVTGGPVPIIEGVRRAAVVPNVPPTTQFAFSSTGSAAYIPGPTSVSSTQSDLALMGRDGKATPLKLPPGPYQGPRVSPDGRFVAYSSDDAKEAIIWVHDLAGTSSATRLTFGGKNLFPVWSADSRSVAYQSDRDGDLSIYRQRADGTGTAERMTKAETGTVHKPEAWSPSGNRLLYSVAKDARYTLWSLNVTDGKSTPWGGVQSTTVPQAVISRDGRWVAYQSSETGSNEIFVQPFPGGGAKYMVPREQDNHHPAWSADGRELYYIPRFGVSYVIPVRTEPRFSFGTPTAIDRGGRSEGPAIAHRNHDVLPDGRIVGVVPGGSATGRAPVPTHIQVVLNWFEDLKQRVPTK